MLLDEPYRWAETVANRREYLEDQLRGGSPAVGIPYDDGALLFTFGRGQRKVFEVYDRVAFAAIGHPADIERLRLAAIDMAHVDGFTNSASDVSLQRLVNFGIAPLIKQTFDEMFRAPYIVRVLMAEVGPSSGACFHTVDYDGAFERAEQSAVIAGTDRAKEAMRSCLEAAGKGQRGLAEALDLALRAWALGRKLGRAEGDEKDPAGSLPLSDREVGEVLQEETRTLTAEAGVLSRPRLSKSKFRALNGDELGAAMAKYL